MHQVVYVSLELRIWLTAGEVEVAENVTDKLIHRGDFVGYWPVVVAESRGLRGVEV